MPRRTSRGKKGFIWLPREASVKWEVEVNGENVRTDILVSEFSKALCPEVGDFKVNLINADSKYSERYSYGQTVKLLVDLSDGTTERFEGKIDKIFNRYDQGIGFVLELSGGHLTSDLMQIKVTESYTGNKSYSDLCSDMEDKYLTGYLSDYSITCSLTSSDLPTVNWDGKPFWDCMHDLCKLSNGEAYVTDDKEIIIRDINSHENNDEAVVWNDTMIDCSGLGKQSISTKNRINIQGDDGEGLPVLYTKNNTSSQELLSALKELTIKDTQISTPAEAEERASAEEEYQNTSGELEGECVSDILPSLEAGDKIYIVNPVMKIHQQSRVYKFTHRFPNEHTTVNVGRVRKLPQLFKKRVEAELALSKLTNPFKMERSINFTFDDDSNISSRDSNVLISGGKVSLSSGTQGVITSSTFNLPDGISEVHLRAVGSNIIGTDFELSTDGGNEHEDLFFEGKKVLDYPVTSDALVVLKITIQSANTEIASLAILYK